MLGNWLNHVSCGGGHITIGPSSALIRPLSVFACALYFGRGGKGCNVDSTDFPAFNSLHFLEKVTKRCWTREHIFMYTLLLLDTNTFLTIIQITLLQRWLHDHDFLYQSFISIKVLFSKSSTLIHREFLRLVGTFFFSSLPHHLIPSAQHPRRLRMASDAECHDNVDNVTQSAIAVKGEKS